MAQRGPRERDKPLILTLIKRIALFCLVISLVSLFFWIVGGFRRFLDETQLLFLSILRYSGVALGLVSVVGISGSIVLPAKRGFGRVLLAIFGYLLLVAAATASVLLSESLSILAAGLSG